MDRRIIEGIEACRPASDDLQRRDLRHVARAIESDPEAAVEYERVQAWDAAISTTMKQVDVPAGLAERIAVRLRAAGPSTSPDIACGCRGVDSSVSTFGTWRTTLRSSRRHWLGSVASVAALVLVSLFLRNWWSRPSEASLDELADRWLLELATDTGSWRAMDAALRDFPISEAVTAVPAGWRPVQSARGVAYRLRSNVGKATLFVLRMAAAGLPSEPPLAPQSSTGGRSVGYWRVGQLVYVLVVEGNPRSYRRLVSTSGTPLA